jgi:proline dehydrogenase
VAARLLRSVFLGASRSPWIARQLRDRAFLRRAASRFMPGEDAAAAIAAAKTLAGSGIGTVLTQLGEQVSSASEADRVRDHYLDVLEQVRAGELPADISVKLTHLGLDVDPEACFARLQALVHGAAASNLYVWMDMEESRYVDRTLALYRRARAERPGVGLCLQAYLRRTPSDLESLVPLGAGIRLVKGAYSEPAELAYPNKADVDRQYLALGRRLLEQKNGGRVVFGTHDRRLIDALAGASSPRDFEIHMLYGIRARDQQELARRGFQVRTLISYGSAWFAWYMRRLAERPANVWFVIRSLV